MNKKVNLYCIVYLVLLTFVGCSPNWNGMRSLKYQRSTTCRKELDIFKQYHDFRTEMLLNSTNRISLMVAYNMSRWDSINPPHGYLMYLRGNSVELHSFNYSDNDFESEALKLNQKQSDSLLKLTILINKFKKTRALHTLRIRRKDIFIRSDYKDRTSYANTSIFSRNVISAWRRREFIKKFEKLIDEIKENNVAK